MEKINKKQLAIIFSGIKCGKEQSFNELYELYYKLIYNIAFSMIKNKDNCEDVVQTVFEKIYKMPKNNLPDNYEASWLYTVTKNEVLQYIKKQKNEVDLNSIYEIQKDDEEIDLIIDADYYNRLMKKLNQKEKEIVSLKVVCDLTFSQISKALNMPIGTVQWYYYKSINVLKVSLSTLSAILVTFIIGLTQIKRNVKISDNSNQNKQLENASSEANKDIDSTPMIDEININKNETNQASIVVENAKTENSGNNIISYSLFGVSIILLITGFVVIKKIKNKIYKKK